MSTKAQRRVVNNELIEAGEEILHGKELMVKAIDNLQALATKDWSVFRQLKDGVIRVRMESTYEALYDAIQELEGMKSELDRISGEITYMMQEHELI